MTRDTYNQRVAALRAAGIPHPTTAQIIVSGAVLTGAAEPITEVRAKHVRLLRDVHYPAAWVFTFKPIKAGTVVPVVPASNMPASAGITYWIDTPELRDDAYGIGIGPGDYEEVTA